MKNLANIVMMMIQLLLELFVGLKEERENLIKMAFGFDRFLVSGVIRRTTMVRRELCAKRRCEFRFFALVD